MLAEILAQPDVYLETMRRASSWQLPRPRVSSIVAVGSGSSFNVALLARHYFEGIAGIPTRVRVASEAFRYETPHPERTLAIALSHSGRSRDVRAAVARAKRQGVRTLAITNIEISPLTRDAELAFVTGAGAGTELRRAFHQRVHRDDRRRASSRVVENGWGNGCGNEQGSVSARGPSSPVKKSRFCSRRKFGGQVQGRCDSAERPS